MLLVQVSLKEIVEEALVSFYWLSDATMHTLLHGVLEEKHSQPSTREWLETAAGGPGTGTCYPSDSKECS